MENTEADPFPPPPSLSPQNITTLLRPRTKPRALSSNPTFFQERGERGSITSELVFYGMRMLKGAPLTQRSESIELGFVEEAGTVDTPG